MLALCLHGGCSHDVSDENVLQKENMLSSTLGARTMCRTMTLATLDDRLFTNVARCTTIRHTDMFSFFFYSENMFSYGHG